MHATGVLARGKEAVDRGAALAVDDDTAHHEVRGRPDLDWPAREVAPKVAAALHHPAEVALHVLRAEMRNVDPHPAVLRAATFADLEERGARDQVARRALHARRVVARHESLAQTIAQIASGAPQAFLEQRAGHQRARNHEAGRVELHHLHVAQWQARAIRERDAVGRLVRGAREDPVHRRPAAHREQRRARPHEREGSGAHVEHDRARGPSDLVEHQLHRPRLLEHADIRARPHLLRQTVHDLDAREVALVDGAVVGLSRERLLVDAALGRAIEEAAVPGLELEHAARGLAHERPHELLVVDEPAALQRVEHVRVVRIGWREDRVVPALHHPRAAGAAEQPLDDDGDGEPRGRIRGVQRSAEAGAARAENQDVDVDQLAGHDARSAVKSARPAGDVHGFVPEVLPMSRP